MTMRPFAIVVSRGGSRWIAALSATALLLVAGIVPLRAVAVPQVTGRIDASRLMFEVASVKPNRSGATELRWTFANGRFTAVNVTLKALISPSLFAALQEQLGLKLESARGPVPVLMIDSVNPLTAD